MITTLADMIQLQQNGEPIFSSTSPANSKTSTNGQTGDLCLALQKPSTGIWLENFFILSQWKYLCQSQPINQMQWCWRAVGFFCRVISIFIDKLIYINRRDFQNQKFFWSVLEALEWDYFCPKKRGNFKWRIQRKQECALLTV